MHFKNKHEEYCQKMLDEAKQTAMAFAMDQDGTVKGGDDERYRKANVAELLQKIARQGKYPLIITASGVTALKSFSPLEKFYAQERPMTSTYIAIGNGAALYCFNRNGRAEIYNNELAPGEVKAIIEIWKRVYASLNIKDSDLQPKGIETFKGFINADWQGDIPEEYLEIFKQYDGRCFTEKIKVTVVFPKWEDLRQRDLVKRFQAALGGKYSASRGDDTFLHINRAFSVDSKLFALREIMSQLKLDEHNMVAFGDMPFDNDKGLLIDSGLPFSFTNRFFEKKNLKKPPFILPGSSESPVASVYQAIDYLLYDEPK